MPNTLLTLCWIGLSQAAPPDSLLTVAERSRFKATATHAQVVELLERMADSSSLVHRTTMGQSGEGRDIPALIVSDPPVTNPEQAAEQARQGDKLIVMAIGNIHGGEVCGKEALGMLARELSAAPGHPLLKDLIVILAPIYNTDGNERFDKNNRPGQKGPEDGMGRRTNAAGLDLNRDFIKLEAPETQALVRFINRWDPSIFIDTHTTNGSYHRYVITYEGPKTPAGSKQLIEFTRDTMFPEITRLANQKYQLPTYFYGNFDPEHSTWTTYEATARFGISYFGLRNRIGILSEAYSYATYKQRVLGTRDFVKACLEYAAANKASIHKLLNAIDAETIAAGKEPQAHDRVTLRSAIAAAPKHVQIAGYVEEPAEESSGAMPHYGPRTVSTGVAHDYTVELWNRFEAVHAVRRPFAYLIPRELTAVIDKLRQHGIRVDALKEPAELPVEVYLVDSVSHDEREFQGHRLATVECTPRTERRRVPAGAVVVRTAQPLGNLVVYLLEPESEDGLATWNYFDEQLKANADFPVVRVPAPADLP